MALFMYTFSLSCLFVNLIYALQRFAIRCMRELKLNRGLSQRNSSVACKICGKDFTAAATLMYHYRSHASE